MDKITILFFASNPYNSIRLTLDEEIRGIEKRIKASKYRDSIILKSNWAVRPDDLLQSLNEYKPQIVHFSGHGSSTNGLVFHDENEKETFVSSVALDRLFCSMKDNIRIVVLNACFSSIQAKVIVKHIDFVIGMKDSIGDKAARIFSASFYRALGFGRSIKNAFDQGLASISLEDLGYDNVPVLLIRKGISARKTRLINENLIADETNKTKFSVDDFINIKKSVPNKRMQKSYGRRFLDKVLPPIVGKLRYKQALSIVILDIDELTIINKYYGKQVGNNIIATIARILFIESGTEYSGRCGDDTYFVFLPGYNLADTKTIAEKLRQIVEAQPWSTYASELRVTCSFGFAQLNKNEPVRDWVIRAAIGIKEAKEINRNTIKAGPSFLAKNQSREYSSYWS